MKSVAVKIFGNEYNVRADRDGSHVIEIAGIVDQKMHEIDEQFHQHSATKTAVLACLNLVDEYSSLQKQEADWVSERIGVLIDKLEAVL